MRRIDTLIQRFDGSIQLIQNGDKKEVQTLDLAEWQIAQCGNHAIRHLHPAGGYNGTKIFGNHR